MIYPKSFKNDLLTCKTKSCITNVSGIQERVLNYEFLLYFPTPISTPSPTSARERKCLWYSASLSSKVQGKSASQAQGFLVLAERLEYL